MSVDWDDEGGFSCGGAVTASKKLKKIDGSVEKQPPPRIPKSLLFIPPSRRPKKSQRLRPEKWKAAFDLEGRPVGFHKLLKIIRKGGVDHSIRAEVWEFLLGCYELGTTLAYRELVRQARRERYNELLEQCRKMHSSIGTGSLAYTVGSKLMDVRVASNDNARKEDTTPLVETTSGTQSLNESENNLSLVVREGPQFGRRGADVVPDELGFQESLPGQVDSLETCNPVVVRDMDVEGGQREGERLVPVKVDSSFIKSVDLDSLPGPRLSGDAERVTDWLWTLHRIVVDVVRTDKHLEFYNEGKNSARMSDILAVYAWVDPATGYCQGMSDLLSPFIVLFDIDADAFWCFESLLKRVRENFQMEGPVRVMKQLEAMPKIMDVTDADMLKHLVLVGADNFLFAFRMLLVLFRRELSFPEALYMWEMMWAADFHQATAWSFEYHCLEALRLPNFGSTARVFPLEEASMPELSASTPPTSPERLNTPSFDSLRCRALAAKQRSFCGLRPGRLWQFPRSRLHSTTVGLLSPDGDQDISVFCVAAIIEQNRAMLLEKLQSMDDAIKIFNNMEMEFKVHSCVNNAVKLRKRYRNQSSKRVMLERRSIARQAWSL